MKRLQADPEDLRGSRLVVIRRFQRFQDQELFGLAYGGAHAQPDRIGLKHRRTRYHLSETRGKMFGFDHRAFADDNCALQHVAELAHIARPRIVAENVHHRFADHGDVAAVLLVDIRHQRFHEIAEVFLVIAKRWDQDVEDVQPVIEIATQFALGDRFFGTFVGGRDHAHVY